MGYSNNFLISLTILIAIVIAQASLTPAKDTWGDILNKSKNKTVYFHAWGGSPSVNQYLADVSKRAKQSYDIKLVHVKVTNIAETVAKILSEISAGNRKKGKADLMWINGENFWAMKNNNLLHGPFLNQLPNSKFLNLEDPAIKYDFTVLTAGYEVPWGLSQLVFIYDQAKLKTPPKSAVAILEYAKKHPGRITYPEPPDFTGVTFLKQILYELIDEKNVLLKPVSNSDYETQTTKFWQYLAEITPLLWQKGERYPKNFTEQKNLLNQTVIDLSYSFAPASATADVIKGDLPPSVRTYILKEGTISNTHFLAIPINAQNKEAAMVISNMLLSPAEQLSKYDPENWGDFTVLDFNKLSADIKTKFDNIDMGEATLSPQELKPSLPEPHPSWMIKIEDDWRKKFILER